MCMNGGTKRKNVRAHNAMAFYTGLYTYAHSWKSTRTIVALNCCCVCVRARAERSIWWSIAHSISVRYWYWKYEKRNDLIRYMRAFEWDTPKKLDTDTTTTTTNIATQQSMPVSIRLFSFGHSFNFNHFIKRYRWCINIWWMENHKFLQF